jgi:DNA invertase Pin-like site-specific DNA recombinase
MSGRKRGRHIWRITKRSGGIIAGEEGARSKSASQPAKRRAALLANQDEQSRDLGAILDDALATVQPKVRGKKTAQLEPHLEKIVTLLRKGKTQREVAALVGVSKDTLRRALKRKLKRKSTPAPQPSVRAPLKAPPDARPAAPPSAVLDERSGAPRAHPDDNRF